MFSLDNREKLLLLRLARRAMTEAVTGVDAGETIPPELRERECSGAFVTLRRRGRLRGCIGQIDLRQPLGEVVAYSARAAAREDPRFHPLRPEEISETEIELSILSSPEEIRPQQIEVGKHGLIVSRGRQRGLLLPQVATEQKWGSLRFLEETCAKAGLERDAWNDPETQILAFTALVFSESELPEAERLGTPKPGYSSST